MIQLNQQVDADLQAHQKRERDLCHDDKKDSNAERIERGAKSNQIRRSVKVEGESKSNKEGS